MLQITDLSWDLVRASNSCVHPNIQSAMIVTLACN